MSLRVRLPTEERLIVRPIVILGAPRSGSSLLLAALAYHKDLWSLYRESNEFLEGPFHPRLRAWESNALGAEDVTDDVRSALEWEFYRRVGNLERVPFGTLIPLRGRGRRRLSQAIALVSRPFKRPPIRIVEKSPRNTLRVRFLDALFSDALFIHLVRDPRSNIASLYRGWKNPTRYKTYAVPMDLSIQGYESTRWSFVLQPGWRDLAEKTLMEVCAHQWRVCNECCLRDLGAVDPRRVLRIKYEDLIGQPVETLTAVAEWAGLDPAPYERFSRGLPIIQATTPPDPAKWESLRYEIEAVLPQIGSVGRALGYEV